MTPHLAALFERTVTARPREPRGGRPEAVAMEPAAPKQGERRLLVALIASAIADLDGGRSGDRHADPAALAESARRWIQGESCAMPFAVVCEHLGLDEHATRRALLDPADPVRRAVLFVIGTATAA